MLLFHSSGQIQLSGHLEGPLYCNLRRLGFIGFSSYTARERTVYGKIQLLHMVWGTTYSAVEGPEGLIKGKQVNTGDPIT